MARHGEHLSTRGAGGAAYAFILCNVHAKHNINAVKYHRLTCFTSSHTNVSCFRKQFRVLLAQGHGRGVCSAAA